MEHPITSTTTNPTSQEATMDVRYSTTIELLSLYKESINAATTAEVIRALANAARKGHSRFARDTLAAAIAAEGDKKALIETAFEAMPQSLIASRGVQAGWKMQD